MAQMWSSWLNTMRQRTSIKDSFQWENWLQYFGCGFKICPENFFTWPKLFRPNANLAIDVSHLPKLCKFIYLPAHRQTANHFSFHLYFRIGKLAFVTDDSGNVSSGTHAGWARTWSWKAFVSSSSWRALFTWAFPIQKWTYKHRYQDKHLIIIKHLMGSLHLSGTNDHHLHLTRSQGFGPSGLLGFVLRAISTQGCVTHPKLTKLRIYFF